MQQTSRAELSTPSLNIQERNIILSGIIFVSVIAWIYMLYMSWAMENMHLIDMWMPPKGSTRIWTSWDFFMLFSMWLIMMLAMMSPTAAPMVMMFATVNKNKQRKNQPYAPTFIFLSGYLVAWALFSIVATGIQWPLHKIGLLNPMMNSRSYIFSGAILIIAGFYQWTPLKDKCLHQCRTPLGFIMTAWREGRLGAFIMGLHHGLFCVGCCWALMAILFSVGVMNMLWVILITLFVLFEKIAPISPAITRGLTGLGLVAWGMYWTSLYPW